MQTPPTIFISGSGRSGTNITKAIFSQHRDCVSLPFEYRFTIDPGGIIDFIQQCTHSWSPFMIDRRIQNLERFLLSLVRRDEIEWQMAQWVKKVGHTAHAFTPAPYAGWELERWMVGYEDSVQRLISDLVDFRYPAIYPGTEKGLKDPMMYYSSPRSRERLIEVCSRFLGRCFQGLLSREERSVMVEDNTWSILFARDLLDLVPSGRLLHIVRDPRDVLASLQGQRWTPSKLENLVIWYKDIMSRWEDQRQLLSDTEYMEIRMEDLVQDSETTIRSACDFVDLDWDSNMLSVDLSRAHIGRHKSDFSQEQIDMIDDQLGDSIRRYDYVI